MRAGIEVATRDRSVVFACMLLPLFCCYLRKMPFTVSGLSWYSQICTSKNFHLLYTAGLLEKIGLGWLNTTCTLIKLLQHAWVNMTVNLLRSSIECLHLNVMTQWLRKVWCYQPDGRYWTMAIRHLAAKPATNYDQQTAHCSSSWSATEANSEVRNIIV
jgi:hypothetical protein